jgi:hypothetical protein
MSCITVWPRPKSVKRVNVATLNAALCREHLLDVQAKSREYQARADDALSTWNIRAPAFIAGESLDDYRWRLVKEVQKRLPETSTWHGKKIGKLWNNGFEQVENEIYRDCRTAGTQPDSAAPGELRAIERADPITGWKTVEWVGRRSFIHDMKRPIRYVRGFRTDQGYMNTTGQFLR